MDRRETYTDTQNFSTIYDISTERLWEMLEHTFIHPGNINFHRYILSSSKQKRRDYKTILYYFKKMAERTAI